MFTTEYNSTHLYKVHGKMLNTHHDKMESFGFIYMYNNIEPICGVSLINEILFLADGSCVPRETNFHQFFVVFGVMLKFPNFEVRSFSHPMYIQEQEDNVSLVVLLVSTTIKMQNLYKPYTVGSYFISENCVYTISIDIK